MVILPSASASVARRRHSWWVACTGAGGKTATTPAGSARTATRRSPTRCRASTRTSRVKSQAIELKIDANMKNVKFDLKNAESAERKAPPRTPRRSATFRRTVSPASTTSMRMARACHGDPVQGRGQDRAGEALQLRGGRATGRAGPRGNDVLDRTRVRRRACRKARFAETNLPQSLACEKSAAGCPLTRTSSPSSLPGRYLHDELRIRRQGRGARLQERQGRPRGVPGVAEREHRRGSPYRISRKRGSTRVSRTCWWTRGDLPLRPKARFPVPSWCRHPGARGVRDFPQPEAKAPIMVDDGDTALGHEVARASGIGPAQRHRDRWRVRRLEGRGQQGRRRHAAT